MSRYMPYPRYKDSGVEWLGKVPEHWEIDALRRSLIEHKQGFYTTESYNDYGIKLLRITDLQESGKISYKKCPRVSIGNSDKSFLLKNGDFVFARTGGAGSFGYVNQLNEDVIFASYLIRFRFSNIITGNYLKYFFMSSSFINAIESNIHGGVNKNIHAEDIKNQYISKPPKNEQQSIANFLDNATCKIDTLIQKQQNLIELLKEKRQALISHAVTKGLNPHVKMKDSGVEWLGEVPEHWEIERLKYLCYITTGNKDTENKEDDGEYPFYVRSQTVEKINSYSYDGEAILTAGDGAGVGKVFHYVNGKFDYHQRVYMFYKFSRVEGKYLFEYMKNNLYKVALEGGAKSTVDSLRLPLLQNFMITVPSQEEQQDIINYLDNATCKIDTLVSKAQKAIELLKERRTVLISAAVTGKIDVREIA